MKSIRNILSSISAVILLSIPSTANSSVFAFSNNPFGDQVFLTLNDTIVLYSKDTGWYSGANHNPENTNYIASAPGEINSKGYNNWFYFELFDLDEEVTSATLTVYGFTVTAPATYVVYDYGGDISLLTEGTGGVAAFNDLASGDSYGAFAYSSSDNNQFRTLSLNAAALADINAAIGGQFALGGTVGAGGSVVPEPTTWAMMLMGFAGLGGALRARRRMAFTA